MKGQVFHRTGFVGGHALEKEQTEKRISDQQRQTDHRIEEILPSELACPRCGAPAKQVMETKRGIHFRCTNSLCNFDTNQPHDFSKDSRQHYVMKCAQILKDMFPLFNFVHNFPYSPDAFFTGMFNEGVINYDLAIFFFNQKLGRIRVEINRHITQNHFMNADHDVYVIGRKNIVEKLGAKDGIVAHYLVDEPKKKVGLSRLRQIQKICGTSEDKFGNIQYVIPKDLRKVIITFDWKEMRDLLTKNYFSIHLKNLLIK